MRFPFEVPFEEVQADVDEYIFAVFSCLESEFLVVPKGLGFVEYSTFEAGYEALKQATAGFTDPTPTRIFQAVSETPALIVVWATLTAEIAENAEKDLPETGHSQRPLRALR